MKLNYKKIVDKKFETVINGYSPTQVDIYFDIICSDYIEYDEKISKLESKLEIIMQENKSLKKSLSNFEKELNDKNKTTNTLRTHDIDMKIKKA